MIKIDKIPEGFTVEFNGKLVIRHKESDPFLLLGTGRESYSLRHGNFRITDSLEKKEPCTGFDIDGKAGKILFPGKAEVSFKEENSILVLSITALKKEFNRTWISFVSEPGEHFFGGGEQFSYLDLKGKKVPIWVQEQGVGRGRNLVRFLADLHSGAGGSYTSTYFAQPTVVSTRGFYFHSEASAYSLLDFTCPDRFTFSAYEVPQRIILGNHETIKEALAGLSDYLGRQAPLPSWAYDGMWLGVQGGTEAVRKKLEDAQRAGVKVAALWAQDWEGKRITAFGKQLMWNWEYDPNMYPELPTEIKEFRKKGVRFLGYINPFLALEGNLYKEASKKGYCVKNSLGEDYLVVITTFPAAILDLTNPAAFNWIKKVIKENMIGIGLSGWMADFGEYLPTDAVLHSGEKAELVHNLYPALWARANREAVEESGKQGEILFFMRAGYTGSSRYAHIIWAGDQMVNWLTDDGIPSVIPAGLSCGFCGIAYYHSDIGGYTSLMGIKRSKELFIRWAEMAAFTPVMRTHEGNRPDTNWQFNSDPETLEHLARASEIFAGLKPYHLINSEEYTKNGLPPIRHPLLHYPEDPVLLNLKDQYLFGRDILVAPVIRKGRRKRRLYLPEDRWIHLWSGREFGGGWLTVPAPLGKTPVFYRKKAALAGLFASLVR